MQKICKAKFYIIVSWHSAQTFFPPIFFLVSCPEWNVAFLLALECRLSSSSSLLRGGRVFNFRFCGEQRLHHEVTTHTGNNSCYCRWCYKNKKNIFTVLFGKTLFNTFLNVRNEFIIFRSLFFSGTALRHSHYLSCLWSTANKKNHIGTRVQLNYKSQNFKTSP